MAHAHTAHTAHHAANLLKTPEILLEHLAAKRANVLGGQGERDAVLAQVVAQGDLAAEAVAAGRSPILSRLSSSA
jgi:hypothetical protein